MRRRFPVARLRRLCQRRSCSRQSGWNGLREPRAGSSKTEGNSRGVSTQRRGRTRCLFSRLRQFRPTVSFGTIHRSPRNARRHCQRFSIVSVEARGSGIRARKRAGHPPAASRSNPPPSSRRKQGPEPQGRMIAEGNDRVSNVRARRMGTARASLGRDDR